MHNYTFLQKALHRLALSSNIFKEICFDLEKILFYESKNITDNVFITGLARSGTTTLLNALYKSNKYCSLTYQDMPFILSPNLWSKLYKSTFPISENERAHGDGIKINNQSPEAFEEVFWQIFQNDDNLNDYKKYVSLICKKYKKNHYLCKNNQNIKRIEKILKCYPNSKVIIPFRDPLQHANSLFFQHKKFIELQKEDKFIRNYMFWIGHREFGIDYKPFKINGLKFCDINNFNHWIEQWYLSYEFLSNYKGLNNVKFICYEDLCNNDETWNKLLNFLGIDKKIIFNFKESKKNITSTFNKRLLEDCNNIYMELKREF